MLMLLFIIVFCLSLLAQNWRLAIVTMVIWLIVDRENASSFLVKGPILLVGIVTWLCIPLLILILAGLIFGWRPW